MARVVAAVLPSAPEERREIYRQGSVHRKGDSWFLRYRDDFVVDGKTVRKQVVVKLADYSDRYRRESDLDDLVAEKLAGVRRASQCPGSGDSFISYVEHVYFPHALTVNEASTCAGYKSYWKRYIKPRVKDYALRDFTVAITSRLLADVAANYSVNVETVKKVRTILSAIFTFALATGAYPGRTAADNPCAGALIPKVRKEKQETVAATFEDVKAILAYLGEEGLDFPRAAIALIVYTGIRPGEARGLRWEDWDRTAEHICVRRSVARRSEGNQDWHGAIRGRRR
jgi:hypothetical protein